MNKNLLIATIKYELNQALPTLSEQKALSDNQVLSEIFTLAVKHDMANFVADFALDFKIELSNELRDKFVSERFTALSRCENFKFELEQLIQILERENIDFVVLKGSHLRQYYPREELRTSSDIDLLLKASEVEKAVELLCLNYGYEKGIRTAHDISVKSQGGVHIELHFDLIESARGIQFSTEQVWHYCHKAKGYNHYYLMDNEMFACYHVAHLAKHMVSAGCGIRPVIDFWVIKNKMGFESEKLLPLLEKCSLLTFYRAIDRLLGVWFDNNEADDLSREFEDFLFASGIYGNNQTMVLINQKKKGGKLKLILSKLFLPFSMLSATYPTLLKWPILYPFFTVVRWLRLLKPSKRKKAINVIKESGRLSREQVESVALFREKIGL